MIENINKAPLQKNKNMTYYHLIIEDYLQNSILNSEQLTQELIQ